MKREQQILIAAGALAYLYYTYFYVKISAQAGKARLRLSAALVNDVEKVAARYNVPANVLAAMVVVESGGNPLTVGSAGERGLLQLKKIAVDDVNKNLGTNIDYAALFSASLNLIAGALYLGLQYKRMKTWAGAIRAYNQGEHGAKSFKGFSYLSRVKKWL